MRVKGDIFIITSSDMMGEIHGMIRKVMHHQAFLLFKNCQTMYETTVTCRMTFNT